MRRVLFNIVAALSLLACLAVCAVWVRSFYVTDQRTLQRAGATYQVMSHAGVVVIQQILPGDGDVRWARPRLTISVLGVELIQGRLNRRRPWRMLLLPYWVPAAVCFIVPGVWMGRRARRQRGVAVCVVCGDEIIAGETCARCAGTMPAARTTGAAQVEPPVEQAAPVEQQSLNPRPVAFRRVV